MRINKHDSTRALFLWKGDNWQFMVNKYAPDKRLHIFFFNVDSVNTYSWQQVLNTRLYDWRDLTVAKLDSLKWIYKYKDN